jgi:hypothetical protein
MYTQVLFANLGAVDHKRRFRDLVVGWPGSVHDFRVLTNSHLYKNIETLLGDLPTTPITTLRDDGTTQTELVPPFVLCDSAYSNETRFVPTYGPTITKRNPITAELSKRLGGIRYCVEHAFGICKGRFRILDRPLECAKEDTARAVVLISSILTLHNFLIDENDSTVIEPVFRTGREIIDVDHGDAVGPDARVQNAKDSTREILWRHVAWSEAGT